MKNGFTLIELMIVVAIIAVIAFISTTHFPSRMEENGNNAVAALKTYRGAQAIYKEAGHSGRNISGFKSAAYNPNFANLGGKAAHVNGAGTPLTLIPDVFANSTSTSGYKGYYFTNSKLVTDWTKEYALHADPCIYGKTGTISYWVKQDGYVLMKDLGGAGSGGNTVIDSTWVVR